ncbi:MAG: helix-turn-helix domain-containing protein [Lactobacillus delbrueckii]|jgi:transcriptional regulator with XRE-family HTH domain|uniref:helix-turn-helix domain-containing protein n=1 Tax=Lactobacillus delbrueckii TaxID=1584 RepID=UPI0002F35531|nr:helix-turn-helix transcriptional regulator [Lactobacillus delbrueckii]MCD5449091.1 helix-turn-helix domain-containing protein [Lactobacillus delbrueckii subsp. bulgaricus]MCH5408871.1 helix-turn-helix domain-containing protein [Lactobacillus delbrueckii]MCT3469486.1 XRE family transcriptional regulator [Lactobacillus delbrueckii subsp. bulgaricus]MEC3724161.1 helix-turn-helix transcriptional regulator [Lactobacillus delbrueckii subsp. bulgaricus]PTE06065.1 XRE family transcriptional regulat
MTVLSERLVSLREQKGWTKTRVANAIKIPVSTYANYEYGRREPDVETIKQLANLYHLSIDYLLGNNTQPADSRPYDLADDEPLTYHGVELPDDLRAYYKSMADAYIKQHRGDDRDA